MNRRTKKVLSLVLATAMVFTMNTIAFGEGASVTAEEVIDAYEPIGGGKHEGDDISREQYAQVPDNWGINSDPATWSTSTRILSTNDFYYSGANDEWTVYSPISYFFNPVSYHLVDGRIVVPNEYSSEQKAKKSDDDDVIYRVIPAGTDTFVLLKVKAQGQIGRKIDVIRWDNEEKKNRITETINDRYNGEEPVVQFSGLKNVDVEIDKEKNELVIKKGEKPVFYVDAVLIKRENGKNTLVKGLSVKDVKFKNNVHASLPEEFGTERPLGKLDDNGSGTIYIYGYEFVIKEGKIVSVKYAGYDYKSQLTKTENANFKGQPSFTVKLDLKGDAKKYKKDVKKAEKYKLEGSKSTQTTFNFEIAQLNVGDWRKDKASVDLPVQITAETGEAAAEALNALVKKYRDAYAAAYKERFPVVNDGQVEYEAEHSVYAYTAELVPADKENTYNGIIYFRDYFMYVDKDVDARRVSNNGVPGCWPDRDIQLFVHKDDVKNLKFKKNNKVSAKLALYTSWQKLFTDNGTETKDGVPVGTRTEAFSYVTTTDKAGGKADVVLTSQTLSDPTFGDIPFAIAQGQNDLTGAVTMRIVTDAHGDETIQYGHYKDENNYTVNSVE